MKITVLQENTAASPDLIPQHGLSLYIETGETRILFDMGQDDTFACNAQRLGIDLSQVDIAVLSHGHYDHGGGLGTFLQLNATAPVYLHEAAFGGYYNGTEKYIGLDASFRSHPRLVFSKETTALLPDILLTDCNDQNWEPCSYGLMYRQGECFTSDRFLHEQYLQITENGKRILISGCSHKGIVNLARYFCPDVLIGGFHLNKIEDTTQLEQISRQLLCTGGVYYTGHCTGSRQFTWLKKSMGSRLQPLSTGTVIEI